MLAADKLLLQSNLKQRTIQLREKELNLFNENISAVGTQSTVLAGFTITCLIEITLPPEPHVVLTTCLPLFAVASICANLLCVTLATMVSVPVSAPTLPPMMGASRKWWSVFSRRVAKEMAWSGETVVCRQTVAPGGSRVMAPASPESGLPKSTSSTALGSIPDYFQQVAVVQEIAQGRELIVLRYTAPPARAAAET